MGAEERAPVFRQRRALFTGENKERARARDCVSYTECIIMQRVDDPPLFVRPVESAYIPGEGRNLLRKSVYIVSGAS